MRNTILLLILIAGACTSCGKKGAGYFLAAQNGPSLPSNVPLTGNDSLTRLFYFNNIVIDSNTNDTFNLPALTQAIIDSGTVAITFRSSLVWLDTWFPLPVYTFPDGSTVTVHRVALQPGIIVLKTVGPTTPAMNYTFSLTK